MKSNFISKKLKVLYPVLGTIIIISMFSLMWFWESYGRQSLLYKQVVVFKENVNRGAVVTEDMLTTVKRPSTDVFKNAITNKNQILNEGVNHFIPAGAMLHPSFFDDPKLIGNKDNFIFKVPTDWVLSVPDSIRRGDEATFYEVDMAAIKNINGLSVNKNTADQLNTTSPEAIDSLKGVLGKDILKTTIAYVKDANNKEVLNSSNADRYDGTAKLSSIEILCTQDQVNALENSYKNGYRFIVLYSEGGEK